MTAAILVCEDDPTHRELIRASLARGDYRLYEIDDGRHLVEAVRSTRPELLILDLRMPESDGVEMLERLRANDAAADIAVLVLSGAVRKTDREAAFAAGADDFLAKPFSPRELANTVEALVARQHARAVRLDAA